MMYAGLFPLVLGAVMAFVAVRFAFGLIGSAIGSMARGFRDNAGGSTWNSRRTVLVMQPGIGLVRVRLPSDPGERFWAIAELRGLDEEDFPPMERSIWRCFAAAFLSVPILLLAAAYSWHHTISEVRWCLLAPAVPAALIAFKYMLYHWQVRTRRLGGLLEFLVTPSAWWPLNSETPSPVNLCAVRRPRRLRDLAETIRIAVIVAFFRVFKPSVAPAPIGTKRLTYSPAIPFGGRTHG